MTDNIITVNDSAIPGQLAAGVRQIIMVAGGWAIGKGYLTTDTLNAIIAIGAVALPLAYGQIKRYQDHSDKKVMAQQLPDAVAKVV